MYGGWDNRADCDKLPQFPKHKKEKYHYDDLRDLCRYAFDKKVRGEGGMNPTILDLKRIECPKELYDLTQIKRSDDPKGFTWATG